MSENRPNVRLLALLCCIAAATMLITAQVNAGPNSETAEAGSEAKAFEGTGFTQDPCSLLTNAEVSQQLGRQVLAVPNPDHQPMCEWTSDGKPGLDTAAFLEYQKENSRFHLDVIRDLKRPKPGPGVQRFDIGDGALLNAARGEINVLVGGATFRIGSGGSTPISEDALVNLARLALPRAH
jgi:hypothetical protein